MDKIVKNIVSPVIYSIMGNQGYSWERRASYAYGVIIDEDQANPDLTRIGNSAMAKNAVVNKLAVQGTLDVSTGELKRFDKLNGNVYADGTDSILDGTNGDVMTYMPPFYFAVEDVSDTVHYIWISPYPITGFQKYPGFCLGCFKASVNNAEYNGVAANSLWSVANSETTFRGGNNDSTNDELEKGFLGKPRTNLSRTSMYNYAQTKGSNYGLIDYNAHLGLFLLFITKYATLNSQKTLSDKDSDGYYTGGLGNGLTTVRSSDWTTYNSLYPLVKCGLTIGLGLTDGQIAKTISDFNSSGDLEVAQNSFMGLEGVFGDIYEWVQGLNIIKASDLYTAYVYDNGINEVTVSGSKHARTFNFATDTSNYIKTLVLGNYFDIFPKTVGNGASSSTYIPDYYYNDQVIGSRVLARSGAAAYGSTPGLATAFTHCSATFANASYGSRLGYYGNVKIVK